MANIITSRQWIQNQTKILHFVFTTSNPKKKERWVEHFNQYPGDDKRSFVQYLKFAGFGLLKRKTENSIPASDVPVEGIPETFSYASFALRYSISKEGLREDANGMNARLPGELKYSSQITKEYQFWNVLNFGFSNQVLYNDGQPLFSQTHPLLKVPGVTQSNLLQNMPLSVEGIQQARLLMATILSDSGLPSSRTPMKLLAPPIADQVAQEVLGSQYKPYTDNNEPNVVAGVLNWYPIEYLEQTDTTSFPWFVLSDKGEPGADGHSLFASVKWDEETGGLRTFYDENLQETIQETEFRATWGSVDWRGTVGSPG